MRILLVAATFFFGYSIGFRNGTYNPAAQLHFMIPLIIFTIAGLSGLEGLFWPDRAAAAKGYEQGSNYQRQSAFAMIAITLTAVLVWVLNWGLHAELAILSAFLMMFFFSALNHAIDAVRRKNYAWQNINRPFILLMLLAGLFYPVVKALGG